MAPTVLAPGFSLREGTHADTEELFRIIILAEKIDPLWNVAVGTCDEAILHKWAMDILGPRWQAPDLSTYLIVEDATEKIVAWTGLQYPWKYRPVSEEFKAKIKSTDLPPFAEGMHEEAMKAFFGALSCTLPYGYDMENDYHRKGTMVHPNYQKRGLGTVLTRHCNAISDKSGDRVFIPARPTSQKMFEDCGCKVLGYYDAHATQWGVDEKWTNTAIMVREAPSS